LSRLKKNAEQSMISVEEHNKRSEVEVKYLVQEFKNKLGYELKVEYQDYLDIKDETYIEPELGLNLKDQLKRIFKILNDNGVKL